MEQTPSRSASVLHLALTGGMVVTVLVLSFLPSRGALDEPSRTLLTFLPFVVAAAAFAVALLHATRMPEGPPGRDAWWRANVGRAIVVWALLEGPGILGGVGYYLTGNPITLLVPATAAVLLTLTAPGRLGPGNS